MSIYEGVLWISGGLLLGLFITILIFLSVWLNPAYEEDDDGNS